MKGTPLLLLLSNPKPEPGPVDPLAQPLLTVVPEEPTPFVEPCRTPCSVDLVHGRKGAPPAIEECGNALNIVGGSCYCGRIVRRWGQYIDTAGWDRGRCPICHEPGEECLCPEEGTPVGEA